MNALPTWGNIDSCVPKFSLHCNICSEDKSIIHSLFGCPVVYETWLESGFATHIWNNDFPTAGLFFLIKP